MSKHKQYFEKRLRELKEDDNFKNIPINEKIQIVSKEWRIIQSGGSISDTTLVKKEPIEQITDLINELKEEYDKNLNLFKKKYEFKYPDFLGQMEDFEDEINRKIDDYINDEQIDLIESINDVWIKIKQSAISLKKDQDSYNKKLQEINENEMGTSTNINYLELSCHQLLTGSIQYTNNIMSMYDKIKEIKKSHLLDKEEELQYITLKHIEKKYEELKDLLGNLKKDRSSE